MDKPISGRISKRSRQPRGQKLPALPQDASVTKRPLLHSAIPSPYAGATSQKVIYVSVKTPFMSAVKRVEKLLRLSDKRLVQSATQLSKDANHRKRRWEREDDQILGIAREVEELKRTGKKGKGAGVEEDGVGEEIVLKATGKAITKGLELGLWFQQRDEYVVRLKTGSASAVDDVTYQEAGGEEDDGEEDATREGAEKKGAQETMASDEPRSQKAPNRQTSRIMKREECKLDDGTKEITETRIRQLSVLEVYVSLR